MSKFIDLTGQRFGKLLVIKRAKNNKSKNSRWECLCDCGNFSTVDGGNLIRKKGRTSSCGCGRLEMLKSKFIDLTGKRFGKLVVIKKSKRPLNVKRGTYWECQCDCGNIKNIDGRSLRRKSTKSCGCLVKETASKLYSLPNGEAAFNRLFNRYKNTSKKRNFIFALSKEKFKLITEQNCFYCGNKPKNISKNIYGKGNIIYNGIDRVDSSKGYIENNIVTCCEKCNQAKSNMSQQEFLSWVERVYNHSIKNKEK